MGACCTSNAGDAPEINSGKPTTVVGNDEQAQLHNENLAATKV